MTIMDFTTNRGEPAWVPHIGFLEAFAVVADRVSCCGQGLAAYAAGILEAVICVKVSFCAPDREA